MVLAKVLSAQFCQLIFALDVVDADLVLIHQFMHEKIHHDVLRARDVDAVAGDVELQHVVDTQRHAAEALIEA